MRITAIMIAAGLSSRMNGSNKLLEFIGAKKLIHHTYDQLVAASFDSIIVVTGRDASLIEEVLLPLISPNTELIYNVEFKKGMTSSIQAGLKVSDGSDAVMICLSDMPEIKSKGYNNLINEFQILGGSDKLLVPFKDGVKGNPVIIGSDYFTQLAEHKEPNGCSAIVKANAENLIKFETNDEAYFFDIDTPESLRTYNSRAK